MLSKVELIAWKKTLEQREIERYWGAVKREARPNCDYTFAALRKNLPVFHEKNRDVFDAEDKPVGSPKRRKV